MSQLIITVFAILLTSALVLAGITYAPWWYKTADNAEIVTVSSLRILEQAYDVSTRANNGLLPPVLSGENDGGFRTNFLPVLKLLPPAVHSFQWKYGAANGLNYFCMESTGSSVNEGAVRGLYRAKAVFSDEQVILNTSCGATSSMAAISGPTPSLALTMYVAFVPGISR
jgi:hypothetical protein